MKLKIKIKRINKNIPLPKVTKKGDWIDLRAAETVHMNAPQAGTLKRHTFKGVEEAHRDVTFDTVIIPLGVAIKLPKGFEAILLPRSSTYKKFGIIQTNHMGIIDNTYCGGTDEWKYPVAAMRDTIISEGDRICQFRIQLSQKATFWQKLKWFLFSGIKFVVVDNLNHKARGGFGSTGVE